MSTGRVFQIVSLLINLVVLFIVLFSSLGLSAFTLAYAQEKELATPTATATEGEPGDTLTQTAEPDPMATQPIVTSEPTEKSAEISSQSVEQLDTGSISGTVTEQATGDPVEHADVCAHDYDTNEFFGCTQTTADGSYTLGNLISGEYNVHVDTPGYAWQHYNGQTRWYDADPVQVTVGQDTPNIDFALLPGGTIEGHVYEVDGTTPIPNMNIELDGYGHGTCTDENGYYSYQSVPYGDVRIKAAGGDNWCDNGPNGYVRQYYDSALDWDSATVLTVDASTPSHSGIDFALEEGGSVSGTVTEQVSGDPIQGAWVCFEGYDNHIFYHCAETDSDGGYQKLGLPTGDYRVNIEESGYAWQYYVDHLDWDDADRVSVVSLENTSNIDFALDQEGVISGYVYDQGGAPLEQIPVLVHWPGVGKVVCTDSNGYYEIGSIPHGDWRVYAATNEFTDYCTGSENYREQIYDGVYDEEDAAVLTIDAGSLSYIGIDFYLAVCRREVQK
jgi:hypothetical protein